MKAKRGPEADLSTVNISILINTLQTILVHSDPISLSVIILNLERDSDARTTKGGGVCVFVCVCLDKEN